MQRWSSDTRYRRYPSVLALVAIPLGLLLGWLSGGRVGALASIKLKSEWFVLSAFLVQAVLRGRLAGTRPNPAGLLVWAAVSLVLVLLLAMQKRWLGLRVIAAGTTLNLLVALLNQGMPVAPSAADLVGGITASSGGFYQLAHDATYAIWLGDVLPADVGFATYMLSAGDVLLCVGAVIFVVSAMTARFQPAERVAD